MYMWGWANHACSVSIAGVCDDVPCRDIPKSAADCERATGVLPTQASAGASAEAMRSFPALERSIVFLRRQRRLLAVGLFLGVLLAIFEVSGLRDHFNLAFIRQLILQHRVGGLLLFVLLFSFGNLIQIPGWVFFVAAVLTLGSVWGGVVTYVAAVTSCAITFVTIRALGGDALRLFKNRIAVRLLRQLDARPIASVALLRVLFQTVPALNYALAMSGIKFRTYLIGTLVGLPVPIALYCIFFNIMANWLHVS
jgi:uncharacterized membrane protein YdjX (TVP38/TMEM64 family)